MNVTILKKNFLKNSLILVVIEDQQNLISEVLTIIYLEGFKFSNYWHTTKLKHKFSEETEILCIILVIIINELILYTTTT